MSVALALNLHERSTVEAVFERLFPGTERTRSGRNRRRRVPGRALAGAYRDHRETYRAGLAALDQASRQIHGAHFAGCMSDQQDTLLSMLERGEAPHPVRRFAASIF